MPKHFLKIREPIVWTILNHSLIIGKKKSRKTLFIVWLIHQYIQQGGNIDEILICDTEQGGKHVWKTRERVFKLTGMWINILSLRGLGPLDRRKGIADAITELKVKIVFIDGIRDLLSNINDPDQCTDLVTWIEQLSVANRLHIVNILHQNKVDNNAGGI